MSFSDKLSLLNLNEDVLLHIFSFLDQASLQILPLVCKNIRDLLYQPFLWRDRLLCLHHTLDSNTATNLKNRKIRAIKLSGDNLTEETVAQCNATESITTLVLVSDKDHYNDLTIEHNKPPCFAHVKCLIDIREIQTFHVQFLMDSSFIRLLPTFPKLREIHLLENNFDSISPFIFQMIAKTLPELHHLKTSFTPILKCMVT